MAIRMRRYNAGRIARWGTSRASSDPLDAAIRLVPMLYRPGGRHGINGSEEKNANKTQHLAS